MKSRAEYQVIGFERLAVGDLVPHPEAAKIPIDAADREYLRDMIRAQGVRVPLLVTAQASPSGSRQVLDGCNRLEIAREVSEASTVPCLLVETNDPAGLATMCAITGRSRCTGQRILYWLEEHREMVLKVAEMEGDLHTRIARLKRPAGHVTGREIIGEFADFTSEAIAKKLHVSDKDVRNGIDLLRQAAEVEAMVAGTDKPAAAAAEKTAATLATMRLRILSGTTPIRRWKAAAAGKRADQCGKSDADYAQVAVDAVKSLQNAIRHWRELSTDDRSSIEKRMRALAAELPEALKAIFEA